jgi:phosphoribosylaminoimidazole (AIR) synthetase
MSGTTIVTALLAHTSIYVKPILELLAQIEVRSIIHSTGGGLLIENPTSCDSSKHQSSYQYSLLAAVPAIFL